MTTKVTIDAHAGWPVRVMLINKVGGNIAHEKVVPPNTKETFHIHDGVWLKAVEQEKAS